MSSNKILLNNGERLGIKDPATIQKAETFFRVLNSKPSTKTLSDIGKIIICLDLAAARHGITFDKDTALKLTGLRTSVYQNNRNNIEKILNLDKPITVNELCVQFGCTEVKDTAEHILQNYKEQDVKIKDVGHPQYVAAAVYISCKLSGLKVDKTKFKLISHLKLIQWNELVEEFNKFASLVGIKSGKKKKAQKETESAELMETEDGSHVKIKAKQDEDLIEDYEIWRERILKEASAQILDKEIDNAIY